MVLATWLPGEIKDIRGLLSYAVSLSEGRLVKKHVDQIRYITVTVPDASEDDYQHW